MQNAVVMKKCLMNLLKFAVFSFAICALVNPLFARLSDRMSVGENELKQTNWNGYKLETFKVNDRHAIVIIPKNPRKDRAWAVRPAWYGAFANADHELLNRGFFIAFYDLSYTFASPEALKAFDDFYNEVLKRYNLSKTLSFIGMSRGGLTSLMWANQNPQKVACVYVDNPVCDSLSIGGDWKDGLQVEWGLNDLTNFKGSPIHNYIELAKSKTPVLMVAAGKDEAVNYEKNEKVYVELFQKAGGDITEIFKENGKHHPHGFDDPAIVADFIENANNAKKCN